MELLEDADRIRAGERPDSTPFGWVDIDEITGGMEAGDLVVIAAPEKSGKTTMMLQIALHNARLDRPVMIYSTEMKPKALLNRLNLLETGLSWTGYKQGKYTDKNWETYAANLAKYGSLPLFIRYGNFSVLDIMAESKYVIRKHGVKLLAVDYIQRIEGMESRKVDTREREVAMISSGLKSLAMEYNIPVLALSQVNADLRARESRAIEQDMDKMITIDTTERKNVTDPLCAVDLKLRQRMGPGATAGELKLLYDSRTGSWKNHSPVSPSFA
jgi:replicative DNA helicase